MDADCLRLRFQAVHQVHHHDGHVAERPCRSFVFSPKSRKVAATVCANLGESRARFLTSVFVYAQECERRLFAHEPRLRRFEKDSCPGVSITSSPGLTGSRTFESEKKKTQRCDFEDVRVSQKRRDARFATVARCVFFFLSLKKPRAKTRPKGHRSRGQFERLGAAREDLVEEREFLGFLRIEEVGDRPVRLDSRIYIRVFPSREPPEYVSQGALF